MWRIRTEKNKPGQISTFNDKQLKSLRKVLKRLDDGKQLDDFILLYNITDEKNAEKMVAKPLDKPARIV